ncbi:MAG: hypothetical protein K6L75_13810 [Cellvibrionaceae bacterium]
MANIKQASPIDTARRIHWWIVFVLHIVLGVELIFTIINANWINVFLILAIMSLMLIPIFLGHKFQLDIPSEFQILAIIFVFASLFLGEVRSYYEKLWWWDIVLHGSSGLLLGILGFLLIYILNENEQAEIHMRPRFVAFFAFLFAIAVGALWEIAEFGADQLLGANMQKPMLGDESGLTDTMYDLMVDTVGALVISILGWSYMIRQEVSFIEKWIRKFIQRNPHLFKNS